MSHKIIQIESTYINVGQIAYIEFKKRNPPGHQPQMQQQQRPFPLAEMDAPDGRTTLTIFFAGGPTKEFYGEAAERGSKRIALLLDGE